MAPRARAEQGEACHVAGARKPRRQGLRRAMGQADGRQRPLCRNAAHPLRDRLQAAPAQSQPRPNLAARHDEILSAAQIEGTAQPVLAVALLLVGLVAIDEPLETVSYTHLTLP